jgi:hypothetical protein
VYPRSPRRGAQGVLVGVHIGSATTVPGEVTALEAWDGQGDPQGPTWRVSASADEIDRSGRRVGSIGVIYDRW